MENIYSLVDDEGDEMYMAVSADIPVAEVRKEIEKIEKAWYEEAYPDNLINVILGRLPCDWNAHLVTLHTIQL